MWYKKVKMKRYFNPKIKPLSVVLCIAFLSSCATVLRFKIEHPPLVDMYDIEAITVIPFETGDDIISKAYFL
jgi:hypothetical protein